MSCFYCIYEQSDCNLGVRLLMSYSVVVKNEMLYDVFKCMVYPVLPKNGSLDNAVRKFSLV